MKVQLQTVYDAGEAATITNWVLEEYSGKNRQQRRLSTSEQVNSEALSVIENALQQLLHYKPVQYVLGYAAFCRLRFNVNESVLIPRPETEELVEWIVNDYKKNPNNCKILDIGTGSGCIPVSLKKYLPHVDITAIDISVTALETAVVNAATHHTAVHFQQLDFLEETSWQQLGKYDVIVSNPPYIPQQEKATMHKNVTTWEPAIALFIPDEQPLLFYEKIARFGKTHLYTGGTIYLETHQYYAAAVQQLFEQQGYSATLKKDLHRNERMVKIVNSQ